MNLLKTLSRRVLNMYKDGDFTGCLGSLPQWFTILTVKIFSICLARICLAAGCDHCLLPFCRRPLRKVWLSSSYPLILVDDSNLIPLAFFSWIYMYITPLAAAYMWYASASLPSWLPSLGLSPVFQHFSYIWMQYFSCSPIRAEEKGINTSLWCLLCVHEFSTCCH